MLCTHAVGVSMDDPAHVQIWVGVSLQGLQGRQSKGVEGGLSRSELGESYSKRTCAWVQTGVQTGVQIHTNICHYVYHCFNVYHISYFITARMRECMHWYKRRHIL